MDRYLRTEIRPGSTGLRRLCFTILVHNAEVRWTENRSLGAGVFAFLFRPETLAPEHVEANDGSSLA